MKQIQSYGDLLELSKTKKTDGLVKLLRLSFRLWCTRHGMRTMDPESLERWCAEGITLEEMGPLLTAAFNK